MKRIVDWFRQQVIKYRYLWAIRLLIPIYPYLFIYLDRDRTEDGATVQAMVFAESEKILNKIVGFEEK